MTQETSSTTPLRLSHSVSLPHWKPEVDAEQCIACGDLGVATFIDPSVRPLATVWWPESSREAEQMETLPHRFVRCIHCGHVFNQRFSYAEVPYRQKPNRMFNQGHRWKQHVLEVLEKATDLLPESPSVVEIGCGDGDLLRELASRFIGGRFVGFDPHATASRGGSLEFRDTLFVAKQHVAELQPDLIICRHVLEHLSNPLQFVARLQLAVTATGRPTQLYAEVPCVDRAIQTTRLADYYYEHNSHFTTRSLSTMLKRAGGTVRDLDRYYHDEVLGAFVEFSPKIEATHLVQETESHRLAAKRARQAISRQLSELSDSPNTIAIWGGTGKAAAFMQQYHVDRQRFPLVVDSDPDKCGTYVPGTGQCIRSVETLHQHPDLVVIIPMPWRARDILAEMQQKRIRYHRVLIEHRRKLVDFDNDQHSY